MGLISPIIIGILAHSILLGIGSFLPIIIAVAYYLTDIGSKRELRLSKREDDNLEKLENQCENLKKKAQIKSKDSDKVIENCDKVLKAIKDLNHAKIVEYENKEKESDMKIIGKLQEFISKPRTMGDGADAVGMYLYYKLYGMDKLVSHIIKNKKNFDPVDITDDVYSGYDKKLNKNMKGIIDKNNDKARQIHFNDDYGIILGEKDNKLYYYSGNDDAGLCNSKDIESLSSLQFSKKDVEDLIKQYNIKL